MLTTFHRKFAFASISMSNEEKNERRTLASLPECLKIIFVFFSVCASMQMVAGIFSGAPIFERFESLRQKK